MKIYIPCMFAALTTATFWIYIHQNAQSFASSLAASVGLARCLHICFRTKWKHTLGVKISTKYCTRLCVCFYGLKQLERALFIHAIAMSLKAVNLN